MQRGGLVRSGRADHHVPGQFLHLAPLPSGEAKRAPSRSSAACLKRARMDSSSFATRSSVAHRCRMLTRQAGRGWCHDVGVYPLMVRRLPARSPRGGSSRGSAYRCRSAHRFGIAPAFGRAASGRPALAPSSRAPRARARRGQLGVRVRSAAGRRGIGVPDDDDRAGQFASSAAAIFLQQRARNSAAGRDRRPTQNWRSSRSASVMRRRPPLTVTGTPSSALGSAASADCAGRGAGVGAAWTRLARRAPGFAPSQVSAVVRRPAGAALPA